MTSRKLGALLQAVPPATARVVPETAAAAKPQPAARRPVPVAARDEPEVPLQVLVPAHIREELGIKAGTNERPVFVA